MEITLAKRSSKSGTYLEESPMSDHEEYRKVMIRLLSMSIVGPYGVLRLREEDAWRWTSNAWLL